MSQTQDQPTTALSRYQLILNDAGYRTHITTLEHDQPGPLAVAFPADNNKRDRNLLIETIPRAVEERADDAEIVVFSYVYPYTLEDMEAMSELVRLLFILNRLLPIGAHQFCEETPGVFFTYRLLTETAAALSETALLDAVGMIAAFTQSHGALIDKVAHGQSDCESVVRELNRYGLRPQPIFTTALAAK